MLNEMKRLEEENGVDQIACCREKRERGGTIEGMNGGTTYNQNMIAGSSEASLGIMQWTPSSIGTTRIETSIG